MTYNQLLKRHFTPPEQARFKANTFIRLSSHCDCCVACSINRAFVPRLSPEGLAYWRAIMNRLVRVDVMEGL